MYVKQAVSSIDQKCFFLFHMLAIITSLKMPSVDDGVARSVQWQGCGQDDHTSDHPTSLYSVRESMFLFPLYIISFHLFYFWLMSENLITWAMQWKQCGCSCHPCTDTSSPFWFTVQGKSKSTDNLVFCPRFETGTFGMLNSATAIGLQLSVPRWMQLAYKAQSALIFRSFYAYSDSETHLYDPRRCFWNWFCRGNSYYRDQN